MSSQTNLHDGPQQTSPAALSSDVELSVTDDVPSSKDAITRAYALYQRTKDEEHLVALMRLSRDSMRDVPSSLWPWVYNWWTLRYKNTNIVDDLQGAITVAQQIVDLAPDEHIDKVIYLNNLGFSFRSRFDRLFAPDDIEQSIAAFRRVVEVARVQHPDEPDYQSFGATNLALILRYRYELLGQLPDLEDAISAIRLALQLTASGNANEPARHSVLGQCLCLRFDSLGSADDLEDAIMAHNKAVDLTPNDHPDKPVRFNNLGHCLGRQFVQAGHLDVLERAIATIHGALELTPEEHPALPVRLNNLGHFLQYRFDQLGELDDIDQAIAILTRAADLTLDIHPDKPIHLTNLSEALRSRFKRYDDLEDLQLAIATQERAVTLSLSGGPSQQAGILGNLGVLLQTRYNRLGALDDLERAIEVQQRAVDLASDVHSLVERSNQLDSLATCLWRRFERVGRLDDLENAIVIERRAIDIAPKDDPTHYNNLGSLLRNRFDRLGTLEDLEDALEAHRRSVELTPDGHTDIPLRLSNLGVCLSHRFHRLMIIDDIEEAIASHSRAVDLTPDDHPDMPLRLNNLGQCFHFCFEHHRDLDALERAIAALLRAVHLTPEGHPDRASRLNNLALFLYYRFDSLRNGEDLEHAIAYQRRAISLVSNDASIQTVLAVNLGCFLIDRYIAFDHPGNLIEGLEILRRMVDLTPEGHPDKPVYLSHLAWALRAVFLREKSAQSFHEAVTCFLSATAQPKMTPRVRYIAANTCVEFIEDHRDFASPEIILQAHGRILEMIPELVWLGYSMTRRMVEIQTLSVLITKAVYAAIDTRSLVKAVEFLEAGRSLVWSQILSLRSPLDELERQHPVLARALQNVHVELQRSINASFPVRSKLPSVHRGNPLAMMTDAEAGRHRRFAIEYERILDEVRRQSGFEGFLRSKKVAALMLSPSLYHGPVIYVNVAQSRCHALILSPDGQVDAVELPELTLERATKLSTQWVACLRQQNVRGRASIGAQSQKVPGRKSNDEPAMRILGYVWSWIVRPILQALDMLCNVTDQQLPHVTWCPTGPLTQLPLHAAGIYGKTGGQRVYDFVISSYTPSLSALSRCHEAVARQLSEPRVLIVTQPDAPGLPPLPGTLVEGERLQALLSSSHTPFTTFNGVEATTSIVSEVLGQHSWMHLACHGSQHLADPTQSAFALHDGPLSLVTLMAMVADNAELAFLSACQTAVGDEKIPEESIHLAAGMLAVGFKGVVATTWSIQDDDAPHVVEAYYETLLRLRASGKVRSGETGAAFALHEATKSLREKIGVDSIVRWAPFVHFGA
ncbi:unnamed protein product [Peniophora sp. CBMAI 1063]|nr:unnamed protein product [Peniophora sp. CBMAI 1063]